MTRARLTIFVLLLMFTALVVAAPELDARVRVGLYIGPGPIWWPPYPYGWYPGPYGYGYPPVVIVEPPPVYIEMPPAPARDWYFCAPSQKYYPYVQTCTEPWIKVPASRP